MSHGFDSPSTVDPSKSSRRRTSPGMEVSEGVILAVLFMQRQPPNEKKCRIRKKNGNYLGIFREPIDKHRFYMA